MRLKHTITTVIAACVLAAMTATAHAVTPSAQPADLTGKWRMAVEMEAGRGTPLLELTQKDGKISGTYTGRYGSSRVEGAVEGRKMSFTVALETTTLAFEGELKDDGTLAGKGNFGEMGTVAWTAAREK
ncbi:MAG: hypothetical protein M3R55_04540 [Acidobacteriota bacterium]|nr:hypothetical protein [Acidobacteriota bacterium]